MPAVARKRGPAWAVPFRSMEWLRRAGFAFRLRALILLVSFAVGSLLARDALLIQQTIVVRAAALGDVDSDEAASMPGLEGRAAAHAIKVRPSGISRRMAMNPWDPPDDDDELDQDSDTVAATYATLAVLPAADSGSIAPACFVEVEHRHIVLVGGPREICRGIWSRGPPA